MTPNVRFTEFLVDIEPSATTKSNASSAHTKLRAILREDADFAPLHKNTLLSGSYKRDMACPRISVHLVKRIPLVSHTPSDSHIPASSAGVWDCKTAQYN